MKTQNLSKWIIPILTIILSLACTASAITTQATKTHPTPPIPVSQSDKNATPEQICAKVTAIQSLNLRATAGGEVIDSLSGGEVVTVADSTLDKWWLVTIDSRAGFAYSDFLEIVECQQSPKN